MNHVRYQLACLLCWAFLLVLGPVSVAHAQGTATGTQYYARSWTTGNEFPTGSGTNPWASLDLACAYTASVGSTGITVTGYSVSGVTCTVTGTNTGNGTPAAPYSYNPRTVAGAVTLPCPAAGTKIVRDFTIGYSTSPNDAQPSAPEIAAYSALRSSSRCVVAGGASCAATLADNARMAYASTQPTSTGLYRISVDFELTYTGASCVASPAENAQSNATEPPPTCPGAYGTVSGRPVCVRSSAAPPATPAPTAADGSPVPVVTGNPAAGSNGSDSMGNRVPTSGTNGGNNGSPITNQDGLPVAWGGGLPSNAGTTAGSTSGGGTSLDPSQIKTDCDKYPNTVGCSEYGTADGSVPLTTTNVALDLTPTPFLSSSGCPAPLTFSLMAATYTVSYQPLCDRLYALRVLFLLSASFIAAYIIANGFKS